MKLSILLITIFFIGDYFCFGNIFESSEITEILKKNYDLGDAYIQLLHQAQRIKRDSDYTQKVYISRKLSSIEDKIDNIAEILKSDKGLSPHISKEFVSTLEDLQKKVNGVNDISSNECPANHLDKRKSSDEDLGTDLIDAFSHSWNICKNPCIARYCDKNGYIVIQQRVNEKENFNRSWDDYKYGFGNYKEGNFWIGNEAIHYITSKSKASLRVEIEQFDGSAFWIEYDHFKIGPESSRYILELRGFSGNGSDALIHQNGKKFGTFDKLDEANSRHCPVLMKGGWWFDNCYRAYLNGPYFNHGCHNIDNEYRGSYWYKNGWCPLSKTKMSIKVYLS